MTSFEQLYEHFNIKNAVSNYGRLGHPDEMIVKKNNQKYLGQDFFNNFYPADFVSQDPNFGKSYETMMKESTKVPLCTASQGMFWKFGI